MMTAKTMSLAILLCLLSPARGDDTLNDAFAVWHFKDLTDSAGADSKLQAQGLVKVGMPCGDADREASLARGGDGYTADCAGGYLLLQARYG